MKLRIGVENLLRSIDYLASEFETSAKTKDFERIMETYRKTMDVVRGYATGAIRELDAIEPSQEVTPP